MSRTERQRVQNLDNHTQKMRSRFLNLGRLFCSLQDRKLLPQRKILGGKHGLATKE